MLKTWITGTKDFTDQGLAPSEWVNDNVTIVDSGKLGKCLYFNGTSSRLSTTGYTLSNKWSWSCWVKEDPSITDWQCVISLNNNGSDSDMQTALWLKANEHRYEVCNNTNYKSTIQYTQGQWNHYAMSFDGTTTKAYLNGNQVATFTSTSILSRTNLTIGARGTSTNGGHSSVSNCLKGYINDLRIWGDHALSPMEVKQISKGLVLHYRLSGVGGENIMPNSRTMALSSANASTGTWRLAGANTMTKSRVAIDDSPIGECYGFQNEGIQTPDDGSCYGIDNFPFEANTDYTISMWARIVNGSEGYAGFNIYSIASEDFPHDWTLMKNYRCATLPSDGSWKRCVYTFTTNSSTNRNIYIGIVTGDTNVTTQMCGIKIEKGLKFTPWMPNPSDTEYSTMGMNDGIEYDCSGFGNNGTRVGDFSWSSDTPRYLVSTKLETEDVSVRHYIDDSSFIRGNINLTTPDKLTIAFWANVNSYGGGAGNGVVATSNNGSLVPVDYNTTALHHRDAQLDSQSSDGIRVSVYSPFINNEWHHYTFTYDGQNWKVYRDGELKATNSFTEAKNLATFGWIYFGYSQAGGLGRANDGYYSDIRVYTTALSADDVLALYNLGGSLDSNGTFHTYEYVEG